MADYYVSSTESINAATGNAGTLGDPMGFSEAMGTLTAGDRAILLDDGTYTTLDQVPIDLAVSGTPTNPIEVVGATSGGVIDGTRVTFDLDRHFVRTNQYEHWIWRNIDFLTSPSRGSLWIWLDPIKHTMRDISVSARNSSGIVDVLKDGGACVCVGVSIDSPSGADPDEHSLITAEGNGDTGSHLIGCSATGGARFGATYPKDSIVLDGCYCDGAQGVALDVGGGLSTHGILVVRNTIIARGSTHAIRAYNNSGTFNDIALDGCVLYDNGGDGVRVDAASRVSVARSVFMLNGGYGVNNQSSDALVAAVECYTASNTSGSHNGGLAVADFTALGMDPFTDAANGDFTLDTGTASGQTLRDANLGIGDGDQDAFPFRALLDPLPTGGGGGGGAVIA